MMYNCNNHKTIFSHNKGVPVANSIHHSNSIYNYFKSLKLGLFLSDVYLNHLMIIMVSVFLRGYRGKTIDFAEVSSMHRTTTAYFLNHGKWDDSALQDILKARVIHTVYQEAYRSGKPIFCIVDDTIASHTKPSSQALHPIEAAYFHQSHLKRRQDYGQFYPKGLLHHWGIKNQPDYLSLRNPPKSQRFCPSFTKNRCGRQPCDRWRT